MFHIRYVSKDDKAFWFTLDQYMQESELDRKIRDRRGYIICDGDAPVGVMRYNLLWDSTPFLTLIYLEDHYRTRGYGRQALLFWEKEMQLLGHKMVMTSTQVDEQAQHFYRKLGYLERGSLFLDGTPIAQAQEMFLLKLLV